MNPAPSRPFEVIASVPDVTAIAAARVTTATISPSTPSDSWNIDTGGEFRVGHLFAGMTGQQGRSCGRFDPFGRRFDGRGGGAVE
ncbi:MAG: hypothetical protein M3Y41_03530, partial [Pseudomonadota bacterium]|nr:hypothetical protein [Pseudomonadota bacterium]